jgi:hypothetical protein
MLREVATESSDGRPARTTYAPNHVAELARLADAWQRRELRLTRDLLKRIKAGANAFAGEEEAPVSARTAPAG